MLQIDELKASLSSLEYQIITECAQSNISETPNLLPPVELDVLAPSPDREKSPVPQSSEVEAVLPSGEPWTAIKVSVTIDLVEMCLRTGPAGDTPLATVQVQCGLLVISESRMPHSAFIFNRSINFDICL